MTDPIKCRESVMEAWIAADEEGEGVLGPKEIVNVFQTLADMVGIETPSATDCRYAFREVDVDGNGLLTFDEFFPYLRAMIMEVVWAEGTLAPCPKCGKRTRERNQAKHMKLCSGEIYPRGSFHFDVAPSTPLEIHSIGPAANATGINEGDILLRFNGVEVHSRSELARLGSPIRGVVAGSQVMIEVKRRGTNTVQTLRHTMFPLAEELLVAACERIIAGSQKKTRATPEVIQMIILDPKRFRETIRACFDMADDQGNGFIQKKSLRKMFHIVNNHIGMSVPPDGKIDKLFEKIDNTEEGSVSFDEIFPILRIHWLADLEAYDNNAVHDGFR
eukprot:TRINITY_DN3792_c0_g1_i3.p1 TRINITY_DN3792_c0_g1~~TRINITY_DN3792_c0_g1_i3.p1  ORF type:complete len:332 (+),score=125.71 TRINITY_DN3792_c0_g1_i3:62-1057(+)